MQEEDQVAEVQPAQTAHVLPPSSQLPQNYSMACLEDTQYLKSPIRLCRRGSSPNANDDLIVQPSMASPGKTSTVLGADCSGGSPGQSSNFGYFNQSNTLRSVKIAKEKMVSLQNFLKTPIEYDVDEFKM